MWGRQIEDADARSELPPEVRDKHSEAVHGEMGESGPAGVTSQLLNEKANGKPALEVREGVKCL